MRPCRQISTASAVLFFPTAAWADMPFLLGSIKPSELAIIALMVTGFYAVLTLLPAALASWLFYQPERQPDGSSKAGRVLRATFITSLLTGASAAALVLATLLDSPSALYETLSNNYQAVHVVGLLCVVLLARALVNQKKEGPMPREPQQSSA